MFSSDDDNGKLVWFFAGAAVGAAIALLYAPASGQEVRRQIGKRAEEGRTKITEASRDLYERGKRLADDASDLMESGRKLVER
jgi:gas vesicle protein